MARRAQGSLPAAPPGAPSAPNLDQTIRRSESLGPARTGAWRRPNLFETLCKPCTVLAGRAVGGILRMCGFCPDTTYKLPKPRLFHTDRSTKHTTHSQRPLRPPHPGPRARPPPTAHPPARPDPAAPLRLLACLVATSCERPAVSHDRRGSPASPHRGPAPGPRRTRLRRPRAAAAARRRQARGAPPAREAGHAAQAPGLCSLHLLQRALRSRALLRLQVGPAAVVGSIERELRIRVACLRHVSTQPCGGGVGGAAVASVLQKGRTQPQRPLSSSVAGRASPQHCQHAR